MNTLFLPIRLSRKQVFYNLSKTLMLRFCLEILYANVNCFLILFIPAGNLHATRVDIGTAVRLSLVIGSITENEVVAFL